MSVSQGSRADARRNRERIVAAAKERFATEGIECQMAEIARHAGVGNATVFRHFPTKRDLVVAVVEDRLVELLALADAAVAQEDPVAGLRMLVDGLAATLVADHGLQQAVETPVASDARVTASRDALLDRLGALVARCQAAGLMRADVEPIDVAVLVHAVASAVTGLDEVRPGVHRRYLALALAGLGTDAAVLGPPLEAPPPTMDEVEAALHVPSARSRS